MLRSVEELLRSEKSGAWVSMEVKGARATSRSLCRPSDCLRSVASAEHVEGDANDVPLTCAVAGRA